MSIQTPYSINSDVKFRPLELIDVDELQKAVREEWFNQTLCEINDSVLRLGVVQGEFHWHKHDHEDEFFLCSFGKASHRFAGSLGRAFTSSGVYRAERNSASDESTGANCHAYDRSEDSDAHRRLRILRQFHTKVTQKNSAAF